ncbi:ParB N-terminal domain-containing protein [Halomonas sp.]|uniref:ParB N-terminal domain-containing protein n=1 Tax=Halomonas sp. TaxID=1486246 RepID=UPI00257AA8D5|nr:ParB N-terminal domain-containing protein [Halomonas sp.]|tara:strand:- start:2770 stop:3873 length:1104 start_codon:yes stop_codon:yes gene_type:complete
MDDSQDQGESQLIFTKDLEFDPENPRFPTEISSGGNDGIVERMVKDERLAELMQSIGVQNFFSGEPLLVTSEGAPEGKFYVVEGNRRLAALKILNGQLTTKKAIPSLQSIIGEAEHKPTEIPCLVFKERKSILRYLGFRHITGIKSWGPLAKARYLQQLKEEFYLEKDESEQNKMLAKEIGSRSDYVGQMLAGLAIYEKAKSENFYNLPGVNEDNIEFTLLTTALSYTNIVDYIGLSSRTSSDLDGVSRNNLRDIFSWIYVVGDDGETVVSDSRRLKDLAAVVANESALESLRKNRDLGTAYMLSEGPKVALAKLLTEAGNKLKAAYDNIPSTPSSNIDNSHLESSQQIFDTAKLVRRLIQEKLDDD